jgi:hypothetical protein
VTAGITALSSLSEGPSWLVDPLGLVRLRPLMHRTLGRPEICVGLIDGPVALHHPDLDGAGVQPCRVPRLRHVPHRTVLPVN